MRVLQVLGSSAGGVARHVGQVAAAAGSRGVEVLVAGPRAVAPQVAPGGSGVRHTPVEITDRPGPGDVAAVLRLRALARGADVVHAHGLRAGALAVLATRTLVRRPGVVVTLHNKPVGGRAVVAVAHGLERVVAHGADAVLGVSGDLVDRAARLGARRTERALVPAPARPELGDPASVRDRLGVAADRALLVTVARLAPQKGLDLLADTAGLLRTRPRPLWLLAGDGPLAGPLERRVRAEGLEVRLLGRREDVADLMAAADLVVSTALWEGQPLGVQEALRLGAAVVATDVGGTREVTGDGAVLVPTVPSEIAAAVDRLLADPDARTALRTRARTRAAQLPHLDDTLDQLERIWSAVRPSRGSRHVG